MLRRLMLFAWAAAVLCAQNESRPAIRKTPAAPTSPSSGKEMYQAYCAACHGETGAGDGFNAFNLDPHPRDLSAPDFQKKKSDADLADAIRRGGSGVGLSALMPPWGHTLSDRQVGELVLYIRTLSKPR